MSHKLDRQIRGRIAKLISMPANKVCTGNDEATLYYDEDVITISGYDEEKE